MSDELLPYFNRELDFFRKLGGEFARKHPKIASRLRLGPDASQDPHVERLVQAFAYLNARTRHKIEDDFPELSDTLLGVIYPHYQRPLPSSAIVELPLDASQAELTSGYTIPRGTQLESEPVDGEPCSYRTVYPVTAWPVRVANAELHDRPFAAPPAQRPEHALSALHVELETYSDNVTWDQIPIDRLRFFLHAGQGQNVWQLYELLLENVSEIAVATGPRDGSPLRLGPAAVVSVGFDRNENMLPYDARSFVGYRVLTEFFAFPRKFLFVDVVFGNRLSAKQLGRKLFLYFYLNRAAGELERNISSENLRLNCTPIVNLNEQRADPFVLTQTQTEYRVVPDARRSGALEIYSIDRVTATTPEGEQVEFKPFFSFRHSDREQAQNTFWHATRYPAAMRPDSLVQDGGTETYLTLLDLGFNTRNPPQWTIDIETTCVNRDLPARLPFGGGRPYFTLPAGRGPLGAVSCLTAPTPTIRPDLKRRAVWRLISHLSLNYLSLVEDGQGVDALREILTLYNSSDRAEVQQMIDGLIEIRSRRVVGRTGGAGGGICRGMEVQLTFDETHFVGSGCYLFASVLDRFFGLYASINSFTRLVASTKQREGRGEPWKWPQRAGEQPLA